MKNSGGAEEEEEKQEEFDKFFRYVFFWVGAGVGFKGYCFLEALTGFLTEVSQKMAHLCETKILNCIGIGCWFFFLGELRDRDRGN